MGSSPEWTVRQFLAGVHDRSVEKLVGLQRRCRVRCRHARSGPRKSGHRAEFEAELAMGPESIDIDVNSRRPRRGRDDGRRGKLHHRRQAVLAGDHAAFDMNLTV